MKKKCSVYLAALFFFTWATISFATCSAADNCDLILNTKCTMCHNLGRICRKIGKKSKSHWRKTIKRMVKHGVPMSKDEQKELATCLYNESESVRNACE